MAPLCKGGSRKAGRGLSRPRTAKSGAFIHFPAQKGAKSGAYREKRQGIPKRDFSNIPFWYAEIRKKGETAMRRLKELREKRGISQLKLAMDLGLTQNSVSRYESGVREADYKTLIALADYFNVSIDYLLERTDSPAITR